MPDRELENQLVERLRGREAERQKAREVEIPSTIALRAHHPPSTIIRDTVMQHDSIYVREFMQGDTVYVTKYRDRWRDKVVHQTDTVYVLQAQPILQSQRDGPSAVGGLTAKRSQFYKNCTWGFFILILLLLGRIAFKLMKLIYLRR